MRKEYTDWIESRQLAIWLSKRFSHLRYDYFNTGTVSPDAPSYIQKASRIIDFVNLTEEERTVAKSLERAQADYDLEIYSSYMDGVAEGVADEKTKTARKMLNEGLRPELVAKCTELSLDTVMAMCL